MAIHPIPDTDRTYMSQTHGTSYLITDPKADRLLAEAHKKTLREKKKITDAWTI
jgi:hypothetical protein